MIDPHLPLKRLQEARAEYDKAYKMKEKAYYRVHGCFCFFRKPSRQLELECELHEAYRVCFRKEDRLRDAMQSYTCQGGLL